MYTVSITGKTDYYPFGLKHKGYGAPTLQEHAYKYNGKELNEELGLDWYDFGARNYDAALGRWMNLDPLAEKYYNLSPNNYTANNPIYFVDPDGERIDISGLSSKHKASFKKFLGTKEGQRFLMLYGSVGQDVMGYKVKQNGKYSHHTVWYESENTHYGTDKGGMTTPYVVSRTTGKLLKRHQVSSRNASGQMAFSVQIGTGESEDKALITIGHESLVHVEQISENVDRIIGKYNSGGFDKESEETGVGKGILFMGAMVDALGGKDGDHKLFVNGKNVSYENFVKELTEIYKTDKHKNQSDEDKKRTKENEGL